MARVDLLHRVGDLPNARPGPRRIHRRLQQVPLGASRDLGDASQRALDFGGVATRPDFLESSHLGLSNRGVVDVAHVEVGVLVNGVLVHPNDHVFATVHSGLAPGRRLLDSQLRHSRHDRFRHSPKRFDFGDQLVGRGVDARRQRLHEVRPRPRIDDRWNSRLLLEDQLGIPSHSGRHVRGQAHRFVVAVGMQRLRTAEDGGHGFDRRAHNVVHGVLLGEARTGGLAMGPQHHRARILRAKFVPHAFRPDPAGRPHLGHFEVEIHADAPEKRQPPGELVDVEALRKRGADIVHAIGNGEGQLLDRRRTRFLHVVAADRDRVELRHVLRRVLDDVGHDSHAGFGRVDVRVPNHELLQDVVLNGSGEVLLGDALLFSGHHETRQDREHRPVHRHRHRDVGKRNRIKKDLHILHGIDRDAGLADIAHHPGMVRVIPAVRRQVEGHREPLLPRGQVGAVERIGLLGRRKPGVLAQRPGTVRVHRGPRSPEKRKHPRQRIHEFEALDILGRVERLDLEAVGRGAHEAIHGSPAELLARHLIPFFELGFRRHSRLPLPCASPGRRRFARRRV